jgi:hypothetical protein
VTAPHCDDDLEPKQPDRSLGELVASMTQDLSTLVRSELELAKTELSEEVRKAKTAGMGLAAAGGAAMGAACALVLAAGFLIAEVTPTWVGFAIDAVVLGVAAAVLAKRGQRQLATVDPAPEQTIETMKENAQWLSEQRS